MSMPQDSNTGVHETETEPIAAQLASLLPPYLWPVLVDGPVVSWREVNHAAEKSRCTVGVHSFSPHSKGTYGWGRGKMGGGGGGNL